MSGVLRVFQSALQKRPLLTQMVSSGLISSAGDCMCQVFEGRKWKDYDLYRTGRFFVLTAFFIAPCLNRWFLILEKVRGGNAKLVPLKRVFIDQLTFAPLFNAIIIFNLRLLEGIGAGKSYEMMKNDWWPIYSSSLKLWPAVQLFNFYLVPLNMRVIVIQMVALFWNSYVSFKTQKKLDRFQEY